MAAKTFKTGCALLDVRRQWLVDFVRENGGHLSGGGDARCMKQLILQFLKAQIGRRSSSREFEAADWQPVRSRRLRSR
jgi:hypothetical protein